MNTSPSVNPFCVQLNKFGMGPTVSTLGKLTQLTGAIENLTCNHDKRVRVQLVNWYVLNSNHLDSHGL